MGTLDYLLSGGQSAPRFSSPPPFRPQPFTGSRDRREKVAPERFDFSQMARTGVEWLTGRTEEAFQFAGMAPARVLESPISLADTAAQRALGFSPVQAIGQTPVGAAAGFAGEAIERVSNFIPSLINSEDAEVWKLVYNLPDETPITTELLASLSKDPRWAYRGGEKADGVPILGALLPGVFGGRDKTVGEFRTELEQRQFFFDENAGTPLDPAQVGEMLASGAKSTHDFGFAAINDNGLVNLAGRLAMDPSNLLLFTPAGGAALAKLGMTAGKVASASRLTKAGAILPKPLAGVEAAQAMLQGNRAASTLKGAANIFKAYRKAAIATGVGEFAVNRAAGAGLLPFSEEIKEFTDAVEANQPLSGNAAFVLLGAATFPYGAYARNTVKAGRNVKAAVAGPSDVTAVMREFGGRQKAWETFGGPDEFSRLIDFTDVQIARDLGLISPGEQQSLMTSFPSMALRRKFEQQALHRVVERARREGKITGQMRLDKIKDWYSKQGGFAGAIDGQPFDKGYRLPWDPQRMAQGWKNWQPVRAKVQPLLDDTGELIWGLRDDVIFAEQIDTVRSSLHGARYTDADGKVRVRADALRDAILDNPNLNSLDKHNRWATWTRDGAPDPIWDSVSRKLGSQKRDAVGIDDYLAELEIYERSAPADLDGPEMLPRSERIEALRAGLRETTDANGAILPDRVEEAQVMQRELETLLAEENGIHWARMEEFDSGNGHDPALLRELDESLPEAIHPPRLSPGIDRLAPEVVERAVALERELIKLNPSYRLKRAPETDILALLPEDGAIATAIKYRRGVREWLFEAGPGSSVSNFWHALTRPISRDELARDARQSVANTFQPLGINKGQMDALLQDMSQAVRETGVEVPRSGFRINIFRDPGSLLPSHMDHIMERVLNQGRDLNRVGPHPAIAKVRAAGGFYRLFSKASSRYSRSIESKARKGDRAAQRLLQAYNVWTETPGLAQMATTQRVMARTFYPLFRFAMDPRWLALNAMEAQILSMSKHGFRRAYQSLDEATPAARRMAGSMKDSPLHEPEAGLFFGRALNGYIAKAFDANSAKSVARVLDEMGDTHPVVVQVRKNMAWEADQIAANAQKALDDRQITQRQFDADVARADRLRQATNRAMSEHIGEQLYGFETKGVGKYIEEQTRAMLRDSEIRQLRDMGLLDKLHEAYQKAWDDAQFLYHGNTSRSTIERMMNSYWFFWPVSYNIKATKWLADTMLNGSFGFNNNALLAGKYALVKQEHEERMKSNPQYAAMMESHPTLWFAAQMLLPMGPDDIGVSMSRATRIAGTGAQSFLNEWLGTEIGAFTADFAVEDPSQAVGWLTKMGAAYTFELAQRLYSEADDVRLPPPSPQPTPSTGIFPSVR